MGFCLKTTISVVLYPMLISLLFFGCESNIPKVEVSQINLVLEIDRFDQSLVKYSESGLNQENLEQLRAEYPQFLPLFIQGAIRVAGPNDSLTAMGLSRFVTDENIRLIADSVQLAFANFSETAQELTNGFKRYQHYFPEAIIPKIVTFYSGFNYAQIADDSLLAIGLDMYLGASSSYYPKLGFPQYRFRNMHPKQIPIDALYSWITTEYDLPNGSNLLQQMVYFGKVHLAINYLLPEAPQHRSFGFTEQQLKWCLSNEAEIWGFLLDQEMMFSNDNTTIRKFIGEGPFTAGFSDEAPAKLGQFIGWRIAQAYMRSNEQTTLKQLLENTNAQEILNQSTYKPSR
jgi:hypothetical protein